MSEEQTLLTSAATPTDTAVAAAGTETAQATQEGAVTATSTTTAEDWRPESLRGEKALEKYKTPEDAYKALVEAQKLIGKKADPLAPPSDDAPQEEKDAFNAKLRELRGVPPEDKIAEAYAVTPPDGAPEGYALDPNLIGAFQKIAHEAGLAPAEWQKMASGYMQLEVAAIIKGRADAKAAQDKAEAALVKEWQEAGHSPKEKFTEALKAAQALGLVGKDGSNNILGELGNRTSLIKALSETVYPLIAEGKLKGGGTSSVAPALSPKEALEKGQALIRDPRYTQGDPEYLREVQAHFARYGDQIVQQHR